jgi:hypothetical protein
MANKRYLLWLILLVSACSPASVQSVEELTAFTTTSFMMTVNAL